MQIQFIIKTDIVTKDFNSSQTETDKKTGICMCQFEIIFINNSLTKKVKGGKIEGNHKRKWAEFPEVRFLGLT